MNESRNPAPDPLEADPQTILEDSSCTRDEKVRRLEDLRHDLVELQVATEENMAGAASSATRVGELLGRVNAALDELRRG